MQIWPSDHATCRINHQQLDGVAPRTRLNHPLRHRVERRERICANALIVPMPNADTAVIEALKTSLLQPAVIGAALSRAVDTLTAETSQRAHIAGELESIERELGRLTEAVAAGQGAIPTLAAAIQSRDARRRELLASRDAERRELPNRVAVQADLEARVREWRSLLQDQARHGRRLLKQLIVGRLTLTPHREEGCYRFRGTGTLLPLLDGVISHFVASPPRHDRLYFEGPFVE